MSRTAVVRSLDRAHKCSTVKTYTSTRPALSMANNSSVHKLLLVETSTEVSKYNTTGVASTRSGNS